MKNSNFLFGRPAFYKMGFLSFLLTFLFVAWMQTDAKAQTNKALYDTPTGNFVTVPVAKERLENALTLLKNQLQPGNQGTQQYNDAYRRYTYFGQIVVNLDEGKGVAASIVASINKIIFSSVETQAAYSTPAQALVEKNAAINLLR